VRHLLPGGWGNGDRVGMWEVLGLVLGWFPYCADLLIGPHLLFLFLANRLPEAMNRITWTKFGYLKLKT
jgi:hypothetical protein